MDHYKCYTVRVTPKTPKFVPVLAVPVGDQFTDPAKLYDIKKPTRLCTPVLDKEHPTGTHTVAKHPACDPHARSGRAGATKQNPSQPKHTPVTGIFVNNQFGPERLDTAKEEELCVPSFKTLTGGAAAAATAGEDVAEYM